MIIAALALGACQGKSPKQEAAAPAAGSATPSATPIAGAPVAISWATCEAALRTVPTLPPPRRIEALLAACQPCGDWAPILTWWVPAAEGGPTRKAIEHAMTGCTAWCEPTAKMRFLGAVDDARGTGSRGPWRVLGEVCREQVSAMPDARYMSATYFALDRIARDAAARPGGPELLAAIELPLPAVSVTGSGLTLPEAPVTKPTRIPAQLTITQSELRIGTLPVARLGPTGVTLVTGAGEPYPGTLVDVRALAAALAPLGDTVTVFAPTGMAATRVVEVVAAAGPATLFLAAASATSPDGWPMHGIVPVALGGTRAPAGVELELGATADAAILVAKAAGAAKLRAVPVTIQIEPTATVASLAKLLGSLAFFQVKAVALVPAGAP